ncbi:hypothetical protein PYCCODRAFT_1463529 [Trametes coccinea BRFM310]|uniref:Uncharacterized protein n=1 Tax=Trametes coccinea (strain BRFM310) TaxID=1353009 RepID=A0A1Y2J2W6_TRAC3|nr:hypothetical protein PYCCODRAFT_1463529 [Trametes coccinea BRFM310]
MSSSTGSSSSSSSSPTHSPTSTNSTSSFPTSSSSTLNGSNSAFFPSPTTDGAAASTSPAAGEPGPPSSSLYLFTFLATLFLLLAISSAIIMRGIFLRRRFRRRLEEAIAAGVLLSPTDDGPGGSGRSPRRKLRRPVLYDVSVLPPFFSTSSPQDGRWEETMPVSASVTAEKPGLDPLPKSESTPSVNATRSGLHLLRALEHANLVLPRMRLRRARAPPARTEPPASDTPPSPPIPLEQRDPVLRAAEVQVAVIIAMPNPHRSAYVSPAAGVGAGVRLSDGGKGKARSTEGWEDAEEEGVPDVILGSAKVSVVVQDEDDRDST